ncbi:YbaB/EbfC family nucleoid-associated protein [Nocardioides marmoraquaticus]
MTQTPDEHPDRAQTPEPLPGDQGGDQGGNPFGGFDLGAVLEQAQAMQSQLVQAQQELAETTVQGSAGGVTVTLDGTGTLTAVDITPGAAQADDDESWTDLGDLVVAAYRDAKGRVDDLAAQALGPFAGGDATGGGGGFDLGGLFGGGGDEPRRPMGF